MGIYFSAINMGFFSSDLYDRGTMPDDSIAIERSEYVRLLEGMSSGKLLKANEKGIPYLVDQETPSEADNELTQRIAMATQQISILTPAVEGGYAKPAHTELLADWQRYRYELTLVLEQPGWPEKPQWPTEPEKVI